jgi:hypothetical protein
LTSEQKDKDDGDERIVMMPHVTRKSERLGVPMKARGFTEGRQKTVDSAVSDGTKKTLIEADTKKAIRKEPCNQLFLVRRLCSNSFRWWHHARWKLISKLPCAFIASLAINVLQANKNWNPSNLRNHRILQAKRQQ